MKTLISIIFFFFSVCQLYGQYLIKGRVVVKHTGTAIEKATISFLKNNKVAFTDQAGYFSVSVEELPDTLTVSVIGFERKALLCTTFSGDEVLISLSPSESVIDEVYVNTGYYSIPKERATGAFTLIDHDLLNRSVSTDIISRLEGVTNGLQFERTGTFGENGETVRLRVRGLSTIHSDESPLIVIDNFPYEGSINDINPNDVESITILRDAAAASIWGARAGNGVIVITTKAGRYGQPVRISWNTNLNAIDRPNLYYNPNYISAPVWMEVEEFLFEKGFYAEEDDFSALPPYVELLIKERKGLLEADEFMVQKNRFQEGDIRRDASRYLYRNGFNQQYALNISGGTANNRFYLSGGFDKNLNNIIGDEYRRINLAFNNSVKIREKLEISLGLYYTVDKKQSNGISLQDIKPLTFSTQPYTSLIGDRGQHLATLRNLRIPYYEGAVANGLLDWAYRPLDERNLSNNIDNNNRIRFDSSLKYRISSNFTTEIRYQYQGGVGKRHTLNDKDSYYARDLVNRFTQSNGTQIIPYGDILLAGGSQHTGHYGRTQINYDNTLDQDHQVAALIGAEYRHDQSTVDPGYLFYGYDDDILTYTNTFDFTRFYPTNPQGRTARIPNNAYSFSHITERNLSYFGNTSYTYLQKYILSLSSRWDASNLFGVKTNQRGVPLWSMGLSWEISKENFWNQDLDMYLRFRTTYGTNGNVNRRASVFPIIRMSTNSISQERVAALVSSGNPSLRWEKVKSFNAGLDFGIVNNKIEGRIEYYHKDAIDLIGERYLDPTTGTNTNTVNYASMGNRGLDIELNTKNLSGPIKWKSTFLFNYTSNRITEYDIDDNFVYAQHLGSTPPPRKGESRDVLYSLPWYGLDSESGFPRVDKDGILDPNYTGYLNNLTFNDLIRSGVKIPPYYGSLRNTLQWKDLSISLNLTWKAGYSFRRNSVDYRRMFSTGVMHADFLNRWKSTGDEYTTNIPAMPTDMDMNRDFVYTQSEFLIEPGDHIRLQDVQLSYVVNQNNLLRRSSITNIKFSIYANNLAMLWQKSNTGLDPDYPNAVYPNPRSIAFGVQANF